MKKVLSILLVLVIVISLAACSGEKNNNKNKVVIAEVVASTGNIDDRSFCQGAYDGIKKYAAESGKTYGYYQSVDDSDNEFLNAIKLAVTGGAEIVVLPGYTFNSALYQAQTQFPDVRFVIIDGEPATADDARCDSNVYGIYFCEQQAGYLAGYAAVVEGNRELGFMGGMAVPAVVRYGYGYVQGIEDAAKDLGLAPGDVHLRYYYTGNFDPSPENQTFAASWYSSGVDCIFFCAGDVSNVGMAAAKQVGPEKTVIGVDVNQGYESDNVLTSAMKSIDVATYDAIKAFYEGNFPGGTIATLDASVNGIGLPLDEETWRFKNFTREMYDELYAKLASGKIAIPTDTDYKSADQIPVELITVEVV